MLNLVSQQRPKPAGFNPAAFLFGVAALIIQWQLLALAVLQPLPPPDTRAPTRIVYVAPELMGLRPTPEDVPVPPLPEPSDDNREPQPANTMAAIRLPEMTTIQPAPLPTVPEPRPVESPSRAEARPVALQPTEPLEPAPLPVHSPAISEKTSEIQVPSALPEPGPPPVAQGENREPQPIRTVMPASPPIARSQRLKGRVTIRITVGANGSVEQAVVEQSTNPIFNQAALDAVKKWKFLPGLANGKPTRSDYLQPFDFNTK